MTGYTPPCCPPGSWPQLQKSITKKDSNNQAPPKGKVVTIEIDDDQEWKTNKEDENAFTVNVDLKKLPIYVVHPKDVGATTSNKNGKCILVLPDVYSVPIFNPTANSLSRIEAICDALALEGYTVALPSLFRDKPFDMAICPPDLSKGETWTTQDVVAEKNGLEWFSHWKYPAIQKTLVATAKFLREQVASTTTDNNVKLGVLGFCYGNWAMARASAEGDLDMTCGVGCHPSLVLDFMYGGVSETELLKQAKAPFLFCTAKNDAECFQKEAKDVLETSGGGVVNFEDMVHGWVSRGDTADETVKRDVEKAMACIVDFFAKNM